MAGFGLGLRATCRRRGPRGGGTPTPSPTPTSLTSPTVTVTSAAGAPPQVDIGLQSDHQAGMYLDVQRANNASSDFSVLTLDISYQLDASDFIDGTITNTDLSAEGYVDPTGPYSQRYRIRAEGDAASDWVVITGTVTASVAVLATSGTGKRSTLDTATYAGLGGRATANENAPINARNNVSTTGQRHFEVTFEANSGAGSPVGTIICGVIDVSADLSGTNIRPGAGSTNPAGVSCIATAGSSNVTKLYNGANAGTAAIGSAFTVGDKIVCEFDTATNIVTFWRVRGAAVTLLFSIAPSSKVPTNYAAFAGAYNTNDLFSINFGASAWAKTPTTGYSGW